MARKTLRAAAMPLTSPGKPRRLGALVASAKRLAARTLSDRKSAKAGESDSNWQQRAWTYYDIVGEQHFIVSTLASRMSQARLYVGKIGDRQKAGAPAQAEDTALFDLLDSVGDSAVGRAPLLERLAVNLQVTGEGWLVGIPPRLIPDMQDPGGDDVLSLVWKVLSVDELSTNSNNGTVTMKWDDGVNIETDPEGLFIIRVWQPHPRYSWLADCATRAAMPTLQELNGLTMHISAQIDSRLAGAGVLFAPDSARQSLLSRVEESGEEFDQDADPFTDALILAMETPISDRSSAAARVPLVVTVPDETTQMFNYMSFATPLDGEARSLREEAIRRLAMSHNAPPEILLGTSGMNHWGAWLVRDDVVKTHLEPMLALICDALTSQFLWPVMEGMGYSEEEREQYVIWYDTSGLTVSPTERQDVLELNARGLVSDEATREVFGYGASEAPTVQGGDPVAERVFAMVTANPSLFRDPGVQALVDGVRYILDGAKDGEAPALPEPPESAAGGQQTPERERSAGVLPQPGTAPDLKP